MPLTLLLDLDDTLLNTNVDSFIPAYFQALAKELAVHIAPANVIGALAAGATKINENEDFSETLEQVFDREFFPRINSSRQSLQPIIENFYDNLFPSLSALTSPKKEAKPLIEWALSQGFRIAIATDPVLPRKAAYHRLRWAGLDPDAFELISALEDFHFSKNHPAYYAEVLGRLGWPDGPVLMVGNDLDRDILPAHKLGLSTYRVIEEPPSPAASPNGGSGSLAHLRRWIKSIDLTSLNPVYKSKDAVMAILYATPAVLSGFSRDLDSSLWSKATGPDDWTLTELVCHLRDSEREIHQMQIKLFSGEVEPFIPRPDTTVWASLRDYLHEDGPAALNEFMHARLETLALLKRIAAEAWAQRARHAIFGPTNFLEVTGFIADHDRMHIQQAWGILRRL